jgi:dTDP-4-dehydrorhamnose reductase
MKIWVAGAGGMFGHAVTGRLHELHVPALLTDRDLDVSDASAVETFARRERPTHVVNATGYTRVDDAEADEKTAHATNALGAECLARAALDLGSRFVHVSTDYVFDGRATQPYTEDAPTNPQSAYGRTKLEGERRVLSLDAAGEGAYVLRTSWLFGEHGKNFVETILGLLATRDELRVVGDQVGRPTYTRDLASVALELIGVGGSKGPCRPGVYHFANGDAVSWHGFAGAIRELALELGFPVRASRVLPVTTAEFPRPAPRPAYSVLDTTRVESVLERTPRPFRVALHDYLVNLQRSGQR